MPPTKLRKLFLETTKGRVLDQLRRSHQTVEELASGLGVTGNAVRLHLAALESDGLVRRAGVRRTGARRPSRTYRLAQGVETLFCQAYIPFLDELLHVVQGRISLPALEKMIRSVGRRLAVPRVRGGLPARVQAAATVIDELGGITEVSTRSNGGVTYVIHGVSCPLTAVVHSHPGLCVAIESLVAEMTQAHARERCIRTADQPHCLIEVTPHAPKPLASKPRGAASR
jgi:predicted ArsR family transcriptional regulator